MTIQTYPYPLGGSNGGNRRAVEASSSNSIDTAYTSDLGARPYISCITTPGSRGTIENAGIRAGEIVGYRAWLVRSDLSLHSVFVDYEWPPGKIHKTNVAMSWFGSGLHAYKDPEDARRQYSCYCVANYGVAIGEVLLWGEVLEHEFGYRAEYAAIKDISYVMMGVFPKKYIRKNHRFWFWQTELGRMREIYGIPTKNSEARS